MEEILNKKITGLEDKIDKIASDSQYMKGQWDSTLPRLVMLIDEHGKRMAQIESEQNNFKGKVAVFGGLAGLGVSTFASWLLKHFT